MTEEQKQSQEPAKYNQELEDKMQNLMVELLAAREAGDTDKADKTQEEINKLRKSDEWQLHLKGARRKIWGEE